MIATNSNDNNLLVLLDLLERASLSCTGEVSNWI